MLAIELDGFESHSSLDAFVSDRIRGSELEALGWRSRHFTKAQVKLDPLGTAANVASALGLVPSGWRRSGAKVASR